MKNIFNAIGDVCSKTPSARRTSLVIVISLEKYSFYGFSVFTYCIHASCLPKLVLSSYVPILNVLNVLFYQHVEIQLTTYDLFELKQINRG